MPANSTGEGKGLSAGLRTPGEDAWLDEIMKASVGYNVRERLAIVLRAYRANLLSQPADSDLRLKMEKLVAKWRNLPVGQLPPGWQRDQIEGYRGAADELSALLTEDSK